MITTATTKANFTPTTLGVNSDVNLIHSQSRIQVFSFWDGFYIGIPASVRNSGVRTIEGRHATLDEALQAAALLVPKYTKILDRKHAAALKMNAAR